MVGPVRDGLRTSMADDWFSLVDADYTCSGIWCCAHIKYWRDH